MWQRILPAFPLNKAPMFKDKFNQEDESKELVGNIKAKCNTDDRGQCWAGSRECLHSSGEQGSP